jgi:hypothetical protein
MRAVLKWRKPKRYRDPALDHQIRRRRTINEVRNMYMAHTIGVKVPPVYFFDPEKTVIIMEYVAGENLRELLNRGDYSHLRDVGVLVGRMHRAGLIHGDLAPTNIILSRGDLYFIDFGLGDIRRGVDAQNSHINGKRRKRPAEDAGPLRGQSREAERPLLDRLQRRNGPKSKRRGKRSGENKSIRTLRRTNIAPASKYAIHTSTAASAGATTAPAQKTCL